ncbi:MAG: hypothetical protein AAF485_26750, partial [Chloroflexota bacterium]
MKISQEMILWFLSIITLTSGVLISILLYVLIAFPAKTSNDLQGKRKITIYSLGILFFTLGIGSGNLIYYLFIGGFSTQAAIIIFVLSLIFGLYQGRHIYGLQ